jgi:hypothetical protein
VANFTDSDGDKGSFRLQSSDSSENAGPILQLWYKHEGSACWEVTQPSLSLVACNQLTGDLSVGSGNSLLGGTLRIRDNRKAVIEQVYTHTARSTTLIAPRSSTACSTALEHHP